MPAHFTKLELILNYKFLDLGKYKIIKPRRHFVVKGVIKPRNHSHVKWAFSKLLFSKLSFCALYYFKLFIYINT